MTGETTGEVFLGRYHCLEPLGIGPLGETWRARVYGLGGFEKEFAVKRLHQHLCVDASFVGRLIRAANASAQLQGERIARVHEIDVDAGQYYLVADLVHGVDLATLLDLLRTNNEPLPVSSVMGLGLDLVETLVYVHARADLEPGGLLHLGLCPRTIMLDAEGDVRLLDVALLGALIGAPLGVQQLAPLEPFLAPELLAGAGLSPASDVYSVGVILRELLGETTEDPAVKSVVRRAHDPDPAERYPSMTALRDALLPLCADRLRARRQLGEIVKRFVIEPASFEEPTQTLPSSMHATRNGRRGDAGDGLDSRSGPPRDAESEDSLEWDSGSDPSLPSADPEEQVTHRVLLPHMLAPMAQMLPKSLPAPPTLPLAAIRSPALVRLRRMGIAVAVTLGAFAVGAALSYRRPSPGSSGARASEKVPGVREALSPVPRASEAPSPSAAPLPSAAPTELQHEVEKRPPPGGVEVVTDPAGAQVWIDGELRGSTPAVLALTPGSHRLAILGEGRRLVRREVELDGAGKRLVEPLEPATLSPVLVGTAGLKVRCQSKDLRLLVDGEDTGHACPNEARLDLAPGRHQLELYSPSSDETIVVHKEVMLRQGKHSKRVYLKY
jgi:serine/threonine protein kinase